MSDVAVAETIAPPDHSFLPSTTGSTPEHVRGRFAPGNSFGKLGGRPKGSRAKLAEMFWHDLHDTWEAYGIQALERVAKEAPTAFARIVASQMPREFLVKASEVDELTDADIVALLVAARSEAAADDSAASGEDPGGETGEETSGGIVP